MKKLILAFYIAIFKTCKINGYESGECISIEIIWNEMDFCENYLSKFVCVPKK